MMFQGGVIVPVVSLLVFYNQGIRGEDVRKVIGYVGETVVLQSGADPSWPLAAFRWSIYENLTYIAIFQNKHVKADFIPLFSGRLELNPSWGDLTIKNISARDEFKYRVDLIGNNPAQRKTTFVQLSVLEQLRKPTVHLQHRILDSKYCVILLLCSSLNSKISLSWEPVSDFSDPFWCGPKSASGKLELWASVTPNQEVTFSCVATDGSRNESCQKSVNCTEPEPRENSTRPESTQAIRARTTEKITVGFIALVFGIVCGLLMAIFLKKV